MIRKYLAKSIILIVCAFGSVAASADFFNGTFNASRFNTVGTTTTVMRPNANNHCFLTRVGVTETDTGGERATCRIRRAGTVWILEAIMGTSSDADIQCSAVCYTNF